MELYSSVRGIAHVPLLYILFAGKIDAKTTNTFWLDYSFKKLKRMFLESYRYWFYPKINNQMESEMFCRKCCFGPLEVQK